MHNFGCKYEVAEIRHTKIVMEEERSRLLGKTQKILDSNYRWEGYTEMKTGDVCTSFSIPEGNNRDMMKKVMSFSVIQMMAAFPSLFFSCPSHSPLSLHILSFLFYALSFLFHWFHWFTCLEFMGDIFASA